jgi:hypothetical protein
VSDRIDVLLFLALAGCQRTKLLEQRATPTGAPQAVKPTQTIPLQPVTPQSIVNDMFPIAPQKTQSVECFCSLIPKMSIYMVVQESGRPDEEVGSGMYVFIYHLHDGSAVTISTPYLTRIDYAGYTDGSGGTSSLLRRK